MRTFKSESVTEAMAKAGKKSRKISPRENLSSIAVAESHDSIPFEVNVDAQATASSTEIEQVIHHPNIAEVNEPFVTRWNHLVSQTNWEKGAIIVQWREEAIAKGLPANQYSDDAWSRSVEGISAQHVGRLRRVYDRFKDSYRSYRGLYWTHFLAAMDWSDCEMWLEGAAQSRWSVSQMRRTRWEALGSDPSQKPKENEVASVESDEDYVALEEEAIEVDREKNDRIGTTGPLAEGPDFGEGERDAISDDNDIGYEDVDDFSEPSSEAEISPFAALPDLPDDIAEAMDQFKLAIVRHRMLQWSEISQTTICQVLDALAAFAKT